MPPLVSYVITTYNRKEDLIDAVESIRTQTYTPLEIVVVIDHSTDGTVDLFAEGGRFNESDIKERYLEDRLGTPEARNIGAEMADGEILVFMDDDAVINDTGATQQIVSAFRGDEELGILALCIENYYTGEIDFAEFPHRDRKSSQEEAFETTYFIGAGHAVRASVLEAAGGYPSHFMLYRFEEVDLSFRVLDAGYCIRYEPSVVVRHKRAPEGRSPDTTIIRYELENRIKTTVRNLPWRYVIVSAFVWTIYTLYRGWPDPRPVLAALISIGRSWPRLRQERSPIRPETIKYLKENAGRLYY